MSAIKIIQGLARKSLIKDQGSGIRSIPSVMEAEAKAGEIAAILQSGGMPLQQLDDYIRSEKDLLKYLNIIKNANKPRVIAGDSPEGRGITEALLGKRGEVVDMAGKKLDTSQGIMGGKSVKELMDSGQVTKGARGMKKSKKVQDREMFQDANKRLKTEAQLKAEMEASNKKAVKNLGNKRQLTEDEYQDFLDEVGGADQLEAYDFDGTVGSANKIKKQQADYMAEMQMEFRKGKLDPEPGSRTPQRKRFLQSKLDEAEASGDARLLSREEREELFDLDDIEDFADGGVAGLLGERTGFQGGGASYKSSSKSSKSKSKSSTSKGPAGGASAGGNYGGNVNPNQTYAGRTLSQRPSNYGGTGPSTTSGGGGGPPGTNTGGGTTTTPTLNRGFLSDVRKINQQRYLNLLKTMKPDDFSTDSILDDTTGLSDEDLNFLSRYGAGKVFKDLSKTNIENFMEITDGVAPKVEDLEMDVDRPRKYDFAELGKTPLDNLALGIDPRKKVLSGIFNKGIKPFFKKGEVGIEYETPDLSKILKERVVRPETDFFKFKSGVDLGKTIEDVYNTGNLKVKPQIGIEGSKGGVNYGITYDKDGNAKFNLFKKFADGGPARQNFKMGKRAFLKAMFSAGAGIAGLKSGLFGIGGKEATKKAVTETVKSAGSGTPPPYFFKLVDKIKTMGDDTLATKIKL
jgi:hypothetical protein